MSDGGLKNVSMSNWTFGHTLNTNCLKLNAISLNRFCSKCYRKKYKKYRLRKDEEDQEVLEVSDILNKSLNFEGLFQAEAVCFEESDKPKNYLSKMAKEKNKSLSTSKGKSKGKSDNIQTRKTDAFQLMMKSRNKVIGSNSPGKECAKVEDSDEIISKRNHKVKRNLALQKMAEAKGALKKVQLEEYQEKCIKQKMIKRATRLKKLITKCNKKVKENDNKNETSTEIISSIVNKTQIKDNKLKGILCTSINIEDNKDIDFKAEIQADTKVNNKGEKATIKEDEEFLRKLSPSIRKKENMLCYFKKLDDSSEKFSSNSSSPISDPIKVKLTTKKKKKSKLSLNKSEAKTDIPEHDVIDLEERDDIILTNDNMNSPKDKTRKRKRTPKQNDVENSETSKTVEPLERRSRRNIKKPIKYIDEMISSSDEDLPIFKLKKPKHTTTNKDEESPKIMERTQTRRPKVKQSSKPKEDIKLAPIFVVKATIDSEALEAKQKFLQSGFPDQLKKNIKQIQATEALSCSFQKVVHVKQYCEDDVTNSNYSIPLMTTDEYDIDDPKDLLCHNLLNLDVQQAKKINLRKLLNKSKKEILRNIKDSYPDFPVSRTYKTLKTKSHGIKTAGFYDLETSSEKNNIEPEILDSNLLCWTEKYRAVSTNEIFGNFENIKDLRKWLVSWKESNLFAKNSQTTKDSDSSDFCQSDTDSKDSIANSNNLLIVTGPTGSGKTSSVYAVANELSIKVIEVNASSRRTGKILLQDLQEATLSHKVNRGKGSSAENSQNTCETNNQNFEKKNKKNNKIILSQGPQAHSQAGDSIYSQDGKHTDLSLILIDDADIVFDQDDGFVSAISQLIHVSKRPVILVTNSMTCPSLQKFSQCGNTIKLHPLPSKILGTWLDILCMADSGLCWPGFGAKVLSRNKGDIRKSMNFLQFVACSEKMLKSIDENSSNEETQDVESLEICDSPDENSNMSWSGKIHKDRNSHDSNFKIEFDSYLSNKSYIFEDWWSMGRSLNNCSLNLSQMGDLIDSFSMSDCISRTASTDVMRPFYSNESASVSEKENCDEFSDGMRLSDEISKYLVNNSNEKIHQSNSLCTEAKMYSDDQRERDKIISRHHMLSSSLVAPSVLDRRAIALDYWSACRTICRIEKRKTDNNSKRNNRFYHYLRTSKVTCRVDVFNKLCNSLKVRDDSAVD